MTAGFVFALAFGIGIVSGLRTVTAPAAVAWAAHLGWINLAGSRFSYVASAWVFGLFSLGALGEFIVDLLPSTPARTSAGPLAARIISGLFSGACVGVAGGFSPWIAAAAGGFGAVAGAFAGYRARTGLVRSLHLPDFAVAIIEDMIAVGAGLLLMSRM